MVALGYANFPVHRDHKMLQQSLPPFSGQKELSGRSMFRRFNPYTHQL